MLWCLLLFVLGVALIVVEFIVPGAVCGILGGILLIASTVAGVNAQPEYALFIICGEFVGALIGIGLGLFLLAKTRLGHALFLPATVADDHTLGYSQSTTIVVGAAGQVLTALRPSGTIEVGTERVDAVSDGAFIDKGATIQIIEVSGNRVVVEAAEASETASHSAAEGQI